MDTTDITTQPIHTRIWREEPEPDNPFAARAAYCHGYDVFGELVAGARWVEMLYLLFRGEAPTCAQAQLLERLAVALANPGPRDAAVHAAMCGGVGGSTAAASLIGALSVGAGRLGGAREVWLAMQGFAAAAGAVARWAAWFAALDDALAPASTWPQCDSAPGFDPHGVATATTVRLLLDRLAEASPGATLPWLRREREALERAAGAPLALTGVAAAAFVDLGFDAEQGEMLTLLLRLPGAAAHALEQAHYGHKRFPFYAIEIENDPALARAATQPESHAAAEQAA